MRTTHAPKTRMAVRRLRHFVIFAVRIVANTTLAAPDVAFPFNSQVPTVARVGQEYSFQFSPSTFAPGSLDFTYSLSNQPAWLSLDGATRTLSGLPTQADEGAVEFTLTAASIDGVAHMPCTLVVLKDPPPQIEEDISDQLAGHANLSSSDPPVITVLASKPFKVQFKKGSFIDIVQRKLYYYATLTDHTPLPSWLIFDSQSLSFSGTTPGLAALPQSWNVEMIASDVEGFAGASASFTIAIGSQQLAFVPQEQFVNVTGGESISFTGLQSSLFKNGVRLGAHDLQSANASVPPWVTFDPNTLAITGTVPQDLKSQNISVIVHDKDGSQAKAVVYLVSSSSTLFVSTLEIITVRAGQDLNYHFPSSLFTSSDVDVQVTLPATARWLHFDAGSRRLSGKVPAEIQSSSVEGKITAKSDSMPEGQTETFTIDILPAIAVGSSTQVSSTSTSTASPGKARDESGSHSRLNSGVVAAVVLGCLLAAAILAACLLLLRRRKKRQSYVESTSSARRKISRPIMQPDEDAITVTTELQRDVEKAADGEGPEPPAEEAERAPQISLDLPPNSQGRNMKWSKRFSRISQVSSLGNGEAAIRADSNIPEWGVKSTAFHNAHESFSVPAEMARLSRQPTNRSPEKKAPRRIRKRRQQSTQSIGLGIDTGDAQMLWRQRSRGTRSHRRAASSNGFSAATDWSSIASLSTRGTSVLSARPSDFPRPPTHSTVGGSRSMPKFSLSESEKRRSIRLVDRSDIVADDRSLHEKRQSFIRNRASASFASPLFANGARVSSGAKQNGRGSLNGLSAAGQRRSQRDHSQLTTYSESSSLEPPPRDPRRLSTKLRTTFAPNFPRAITRSTLDADEEWCTATPSSSSEPDYMAEMALPRGERSWVLPSEASPTPPPCPELRKASGTESSNVPSKSVEPRQKWKERLREHSSPPLSTALAIPLADRNSLSASARASQVRRSKISEPISLVSNDSLSRSKPERPRLVHTSSRRPVSVEKVQRLSSLKAEAVEDARAGSEMFEALEGAGLMPPKLSDGREKEASQKSNFSGPAFL